MATFSSVVCAWVSVFMSMEVHKKKIWLELDQFSLLLSRNRRRPPSLITFSIFPNSQTNHRDNSLLFGLSILIQNFTFLALRRAHQLKTLLLGSSFRRAFHTLNTALQFSFHDFYESGDRDLQMYPNVWHKTGTWSSADTSTCPHVYWECLCHTQWTVEYLLDL